MTRPKEVEDAETRAAHRAMEIYVETLREELRALGSYTTLMEALGKTSHEHVSIIMGERPGVIRFRIDYDDSPLTVHAAAATALRHGHLDKEPHEKE